MMGALCSCFLASDVEEREATSTSNHRNCLIESLKYKCGAFFSGVAIHAVQSVECVASSSSTVSPNTTQIDVNSNVTTNMKFKKSKSQKDLALEGTNPSHLDQSMRKGINLQISSKVQIKDDPKFHHSKVDEDEDVCPTCLEEYTLENPKIFIQCRHGYHLSCIYEWMERSEKCPFCGKLMVFDEMA